MSDRTVIVRTEQYCTWLVFYENDQIQRRLAYNVWKADHRLSRGLAVVSHYCNATSQLRKAVLSRSPKRMVDVTDIHHYYQIMDVAGTTVGIASLGIQVCQGLMSYYDDWKAYDADISSTYRAITDLSKTLTILKTTLQQEMDEERVGRVRTCVKGCEDALLELEQKRHSLQKYCQHEGLRQKMRSGLQRSWYPFRKETLEALKIRVTNVQERLKLALQALQLDIGTESQRLVHRLLSQTTTQSASIAQIAAQTQRVLDTQRSDEFRKIVAWLTPPDPGTNHATARQRHESQTGDWLLKSSQYQDWKAGAVTHLWLYGKAGCGKTILCSTAIEDIQITCDQDTDTSFAFFYFSFSDKRKQSDSDLLRSLVAQLGWREPGLSMLRQAYENPNQGVLGSDELEEILLASIRSCSRVYLLVDALDECPEDHETRQGVLQRIERLTQDASNLRLLTTSRELDRIRKSMQSLASEPLPVITRAVNADIQIYLSTQLSRDRSLCELSSEMRTLIESTIASQADGMFRWAYCQLQELKALDSYKPKYVKEVLQTLSPTLDDTYTRMLTRIKKMYHKEALTLLRWLAYARSPLTLRELVDAAITDPAEESSVDTGERGGLRDVLNILSGLVTIEENQAVDAENSSEIGFTTNKILTASPDQEGAMLRSRYLTPDTRVRLAHFSVKEYLESERVLGSKAGNFHLESALGHVFLAHSCLTYLRYYSASSEKTSTVRDLEVFPLLKYAAQSWFFHSALKRDGEADRETSFLQQNKERYDWLLIHDPDAPSYEPFDGPRYLCPAIYYASRLGLEIVVKELVSSGATINTQGGRYGNPLQAASLRGHISIVQLLLDKGANINAQCGKYGTALQAALEGEHMMLVQLLLDRGADVNAQGGWYGDALQAAAYKGLVDVVRQLLEKGADHKAQGGWYGNAFQAASAQGYAGVVRLLSDNGAVTNTKGGGFGSALQGASFRGHVEMVQLLLDMGADVNLGVGFHGNALCAASEQGHVEVVRLLLDNGAVINARGGQLATALHTAADGGYTKTVQLLLDRGADVNAQSGLFGYALQAASFRGHAEMVQLLLERGADMNARGGFFENALQAAFGGGHMGVAQVLQAAGASDSSLAILEVPS